MGRRESPLEAWCVSWARIRGIVVAKLTLLDGISDRIFFVPGGSPIIGEFKAKGAGSERSRKYTQPWYLAKLIHEGYAAHQWDSKEAFLETMKKYASCRETFKMLELRK